MNKKKTIWFALTNVPHVNFLLPIIRKYESEFDMVFTVRDFAETVSLFEKRIGKPYILIGEHKGWCSNLYANLHDYVYASLPTTQTKSYLNLIWKD